MANQSDDPGEAAQSASDGKPFFAYVIPSGSPLSEGSWGKSIDLFPFQWQMLRRYGTLLDLPIVEPPNKHTGE